MLTTKDIEHLQTAKVASRMSEDRSTQVGCAIVHPTKSVAVFAANKFPRGVANVEARHGRPQKYLYFEHAERNAIYTMASEGASTLGCTLYMASTMPGPPCCDCSRAIIQTGISRVVCTFSSNPLEWREDWRVSMQASLDMLREAGVVVCFEND